MITRDAILAILEDDLGIDTDGIEDDTPLFSSGIVDSFALVTLMMQIEKLEGIRIKPEEVALENLDSVARIIAFVERVKA